MVNGHLPVAPALLFIQHTAAQDYTPVLKFGKEYINDVQPYAQQFIQLLTNTLSEIYNPQHPFTPTTDLSTCATCPYKPLCSL